MVEDDIIIDIKTRRVVNTDTNYLMDIMFFIGTNNTEKNLEFFNFKIIVLGDFDITSEAENEEYIAIYEREFPGLCIKEVNWNKYKDGIIWSGLPKLLHEFQSEIVGLKSRKKALRIEMSCPGISEPIVKYFTFASDGQPKEVEEDDVFGTLASTH